MNLLSKLKAAVGIGGAKIEIDDIEGDGFHWNDTIRGVLTLTGGTEAQKVDRLSVRLVCESWVPARTGYQESYQYFQETNLATDLQVAPASSQQFPFELRVPAYVTPTGLDELQKSVTWFVQGAAHLYHAVDASGGRVVTVWCPRSLSALAYAVELAAPVESHLCYMHYGNRPVVTFEFEPTAEGKQTLERVKLSVEEKDGRVIGTLQIDPQPHSVRENLRALAEKDSRHYDIEFPVDLLFIDAEDKVADAVVAPLKQMFASFISG